MSQPARVDNNAQTVVMDASDFEFETIEHRNGNAVVIRFPLQNPSVVAGDVVVVLSGTEIHFHGMIFGVENGYATASDPRGSLLPATVQ